MARPRRTESASVPIWLKLSEVDAARMNQVLARPEFAGWTRAEWCLEVIQTALRYYTRARPAAEPPPARPAAPAPEPAAPAPEPASPTTEPAAVSEPPAPAPEPVLAPPEPVLAPPEPVLAPPEPVLAPPEPPGQAECSHPADARDYETGTCAACGTILWD